MCPPVHKLLKNKDSRTKGLHFGMTLFLQNNYRQSFASRLYGGKRSNYRKTEFLEGRFNEAGVLSQDGFEVAATVLDVAEN